LQKVGGVFGEGVIKIVNIVRRVASVGIVRSVQVAEHLVHILGHRFRFE